MCKQNLKTNANNAIQNVNLKSSNAHITGSKTDIKIYATPLEGNGEKSG